MTTDNKTVTIDKQLYDKLLTDQKKHNLIFDHMFSGFALHELLYDKHGNPVDYLFLETNKAFTKITGIDYPVGKTILELFPNFDKSWLTIYANTVKTGISNRFQKYHVETDIWYDILCVKAGENQFTCLFTNITSLIIAEKEIQESLHFNNLLINSIPHPAMLIDKDRVILAANTISKNMGAIVGMHCFEGFSACRAYCNKGDSCKFYEKEKSLSSAKKQHMELFNKGKLWNTWWVPINDNSFLHYSIDITDLKKSENVLIEAATELQARNEELEQFAYVASHDMQEPLRVVSSYCQIINEFYYENCKNNLAQDKQKEIEQYLKFIIDATIRMRFLIKDLLEFSRVGRVENTYELVDIAKLIEKVKADFKISIDEHKVEILCSEMPEIMVKRSRISQVFHNLISNAIKFRSNKKVVIKINAQEKKDEWVFSIEDTGIGIDKDFHDRIFGIFKRLHTREEYPGTGIGLALVKKIVENHGGRIWINSEAGEGSIFFFTIPKGWDLIKSQK